MLENTPLRLGGQDMQDAVIHEEIQRRDLRYGMGDVWWTSEEIAGVDLPGEVLLWRRTREHAPHPPSERCRPGERFLTLAVTSTEDGAAYLIVTGREVNCIAYATTREGAGELLAAVPGLIPARRARSRQLGDVDEPR